MSMFETKVRFYEWVYGTFVVSYQLRFLATHTSVCTSSCLYSFQASKIILLWVWYSHEHLDKKASTTYWRRCVDNISALLDDVLHSNVSLPVPTCLVRSLSVVGDNSCWRLVSLLSLESFDLLEIVWGSYTRQGVVYFTFRPRNVLYIWIRLRNVV